MSSMRVLVGVCCVVCAVWQVQVLMDSPCPSASVLPRGPQRCSPSGRERRGHTHACCRVWRAGAAVLGVSSRTLVPRRAAGSFSDFGATGHSTTTLSLSHTHHSPQERARQRRLRVRCALRCKPAAFRSATSFMLSSCPDCPRSSELINSACVRKSDTTWEICPTLSSSAAADC